MELLDAVNEYCDIRKLKNNCNFSGCDKKPSKEMLIFQINMDTRTKRNILSIYLCSHHFMEMEQNLQELLNKFKEGKMFSMKNIDIGFVTF